MAIKVQTPLEYKGEQFYPLTTYDQVIMPDGSRWDGSSSSLDGDENVVTVDLTDIDQGIAAQINADLLGGIPAKDYALKTDIGINDSTSSGEPSINQNVYVGCKMLYAIGKIINSASDVVEGHGNATVMLYPNGLAEIHYSAQITKNGTASTSVFDWGLNSDLLQSCNSEIPDITPMKGGYAVYHSETSGTTLNNSANGMAGIHAGVSQFWQFGRLYTAPTSVGGWPTTMFKTGARIHGVCYGTYTPSIDDFVNEGLTGGSAGNTEITSGLTVDDIYPVGSIYMSVDSTSPASRFANTTWEQLKDRFLIGAGNNYIIESTGGEVEHTLTVDEMPSHDHYGVRRSKTDDNHVGTASTATSSGSADTTYYTDSTGGSQPHNNMPPYLAVYMWRRVS